MTDPSLAPFVITVPGLRNSGPAHWQTLWEAQRGDCLRAELGDWHEPSRYRWVPRLGQIIRAAAARTGAPVVLAAHSLGCHAVAWWASTAPDAAALVRGALLVAPPEVDFFPRDERLSSFSPTPAAPLPFPSLLVASQNDPYIGLHAARQLARRWGSRFVDLGAAGHINADSGLGDWPQGQAWVDELAGIYAPASASGSSIGVSAVCK